MKLLIVGLLTLFCSKSMLAQTQKVVKQGHRGARGLMPENTIASMKTALDWGATVLELDVVISRDKQVVVSHDPYMLSSISLKPGGDSISVSEEKNLILYAMDYADIKKYDVGSKYHPHFPEQKKFKAYKPLLSELIDSVNSYAKEKGMPAPVYNIEIKSQAKTDGIHQPAPAEFVDLVVAICISRNILEKMNIQSFDVRPLRVIHEKYPSIKIGYLTANAKSISENLEDLGFVPHIYSPQYKTVTKATVQECHDKKMKIIPWTVNTKPEIISLIELGVDGIITDYPNLF